MRICCILLACLLGACSELPTQGFATRYLGGTLGPTMRAAVVPATDFAGAPIGQPYHSEFDISPALPRPAPVRGIVPMDCNEVANQRAQDVANEGFDEDLAHTVFESALADCKRWQLRG